VDRDSAARRARRRRPVQGSAEPDDHALLQDAEIWGDSPFDRRAADRWFLTHGTGSDPRD
jgi:hypothetical protein